MNDEKVDKFFTDKPVQRHLFNLIKEYIVSLGQVDIKITKSQIAFVNKRQFTWVWLPMPWDKRRPKNSIVLSFSLDKKIVNPQIVQVVEPYPGRFMHHIIIEKEADMSGDIKKWLTEAYLFNGNNPDK